MAKKKKANLSPDTESFDNVTVSGVLSDTNPPSLAERAEEIGQDLTEIWLDQ